MVKGEQDVTEERAPSVLHDCIMTRADGQTLSNLGAFSSALSRGVTSCQLSCTMALTKTPLPSHDIRRIVQRKRREMDCVKSTFDQLVLHLLALFYPLKLGKLNCSLGEDYFLFIT